MIRKVSGIAALVIAGFFFYMVNILAFINEPELGLMKYAIIAGFSVPAFAALFIGLLLRRFQQWKKDISIVLLSTVAFNTFLIITFLCMFLSPELEVYFPDNPIDFFSDFLSGAVCFAILLVTGLSLYHIQRRAPNNSME